MVATMRNQIDVLNAPNVHNPAQFLTVQEVVATLEISRQAVYDALQRGALKGVRRGQMWFVAHQSVRDYIVDEPRRQAGLCGGRPR